MPDPQLIGLILLLAVAVMFGYFYFKRAQRREVDSAVATTPPARATDSPPAPASTTESVQRDPVDEA